MPPSTAGAEADGSGYPWGADAAGSLQLPGRQLSDTLFDSGVRVIVHRARLAPRDVLGGGCDGSGSESDGDLVSQAPPASSGTRHTTVAGGVSSDAGAVYYVRVLVPPELGKDCVLHWGVDNWRVPPVSCLPPGSKQVCLRVCEYVCVLLLSHVQQSSGWGAARRQCLGHMPDRGAQRKGLSAVTRGVRQQTRLTTALGAPPLGRAGA